MTTISLKKLTIINFKGIKNLVVEFGKITDITGANASGKTSIVDAFRWLMFGKDSADRTDFELQPLDEAGKMVEKVDVEVEAEMEIDFKTVTFKKVNHQKWPKKKGQEKAIYDGTENLYYWNGVPMREIDYKVKVSGVVSENIFKLVTNPHYFNAVKWQERRKTLLEMAGDIDLQAIAASNPKFLAILQELETKNEKEYKDQIAARKTKLKESLKQIPTRIDEKRREMPQVQNWVALLGDLAEKEAQLNGIDNSLLSESQAINSANTEQRDRQVKLHALKTDADKIEYSVKQAIANKRQSRESAIQEEKRKLRGYNDEVSRNTSDLLSTGRRIDLLTTEQAQLRTQWAEVNAKEFKFDETELDGLRAQWAETDAAVFPGISDDECACPTCKRLFDAADVDAKKAQLETNFNESKATKLANLAQKANAIKATQKEQSEQFTENKTKQLAAIEQRAADITTELKSLSVKKETLVSDNQSLTISINTTGKLIFDLETNNSLLNSAEVTQLADELKENSDYQNLLVKIENLKAADQLKEQSQIMNELKAKKQVLVSEIDAIKKELAKEEQIKSCNQRITQLEAEEEGLAQQLAELEGIEFTMLQFNKAKITEVENRINGMFKYARFKMFDQQVNGGETECCETTYLGVPFGDLNTASKMKVGIDIINALSKHYEVVAPIFLDNRESVTDIPDTDAQVINLKVSAADKSLRIEHQAAAVA